ncbi:RhoGAP-domain-containing protein [Neolentinus lepideus HHB14362 ss-1]|uniref:RhoGAP-domain-containing protein n=1 Tax=Neolentinus lepideus HHB14362 ss-1 TaxID=1314782 RepID=A0A165UA06_9AGAM|nr:RhoGAP-domain-containing protein [Neolentinus lepideus HHB14362 ss-1]
MANQLPPDVDYNDSGPFSAPPTAPSRIPERPNVPTRSSTVGSPFDLEHNKQAQAFPISQSRSEDMNHSSSPCDPAVSVPSPAFLSPSRPTTPSSSQQHAPSPTRDNSDGSPRRLSLTSSSSATSGASSSNALGGSGSTTSASASIASASCAACGKPMQGAFVRALGTVYHLNCFKCMDCGTVVASKFFPIDAQDGKQSPLCERDYFRRLSLICAKCGMALRGSYITACNKKFHVEHFTCSLCPTLFGPQDSYYEHEGDVYCHYHYSTRFATKCAGCNSAILKQFVEINRNMRDECWHPECYMINKFWNVKIVSRKSPNSPPASEGQEEEPPWSEEERRETAVSLREKQVRMEQQVYRIWTVLSAFEESSAACISDMLRQVSNGQYLEAIRMAEKFILHVEVLFATIDDLEYYFSSLTVKGMSHVREARMLCRKTVDLLKLLSHTQETGARRMGMTQELLALVTGLAHYLKILIRIALTGALKLERDHNVREAMTSFLDKLHLLAVQGGNPTAKRMIKGAHGEYLPPSNSGNYGTQGVTYGFRSLAPENAGESPFSVAATGSKANPPSDLCVKCNQTVEEDCVRLGTYQRWHSHCVQCQTCGKVAAVPAAKEQSTPKLGDEKDKEVAPKLSTARRPPANVGLFVYDPDSIKELPSFGDVPTVIYCTEHGHPGCRGGFQPVSRLEQYAFLLNVALRRLYILLKKLGVVPSSPAPNPNTGAQKAEHDPYRNSGDIVRMKSVHLDRKLSATARLPKRSTIVESPSGKSAHPNTLHSQRSQPELDSQRPQAYAVQQVPSSSTNSSRAPRTPIQQQSSQQYPSIRPTRADLGPLDTSGTSQIVRPHFARSNTEVMIVDDSAPNSPAGGSDEPTVPTLDDGITLADIPQLVEAAQAREQHRSLPRQTSVPYIAELSALELAIVKHAAALALTKSPLKDQFDLDEILEMIEIKKSGFWGKLFKADNKKNVKKKGVFGVPLELLVEREGADSLLGASRATLRVPSFIDDVVSAMRQMDMSIEGIFRKNGNIRRLKELTEAIDRDPSSVDLTQDNPVQLAALLKKFLRDLPDPLLTFKLHRLFIASQSPSVIPNDNERKRLLHMVSLLLPKYHRDTMEVLFVFLKWVASFAHMDEETGSKMDLGNLATVICPSILYSRGRDAVRDESFGAIRVVTSLLENQDEFFTVPDELLSILQDQDYFANSLDLPSRDFMKKCDAYMRLKAGGRTPGMMSPTLGGSPFFSNTNSANIANLSRSPDGPESRSATPRYVQQNLERPPMSNAAPSDNYPRNGLPSRSRDQSLPTLTHSPQSYPPPSAPSISQNLASIQSPQPRNANTQSDLEWTAQRPAPQPQVANSPSPRPRPNSYIARNSGDHPHVLPPNGHGAPAVQLRQRT